MFLLKDLKGIEEEAFGLPLDSISEFTGVLVGNVKGNPVEVQIVVL